MDGIIGRSGKYVLIQHDNQVITVDLDKIMTSSAMADDTIGWSIHQDFTVNNGSRILRKSTTAQIILQYLLTAIKENIKEKSDV